MWLTGASLAAAEGPRREAGMLKRAACLDLRVYTGKSAPTTTKKGCGRGSEPPKAIVRLRGAGESSVMIIMFDVT